MRRCIKRIKDNAPNDLEELKLNYDKQDIINLNLQRSIQISVDIGSHILSRVCGEQVQTMAETFLLLGGQGIIPETLADKLGKAVGFRNVAVHEYTRLNLEILYKIVTEEMGCFSEFSKIIFALCNNGAD